MGLREHATRQVPAAPQLPPARDLPAPGAEAGRRRAGDVVAERPVLDRRSPPQLRVLRPDHHRRLVALGVRPGDGRGRRSDSTSSPCGTSGKRCSSTSPTCTGTHATACTSRRQEACGGRSCSGSPACSRPARRSASIPACRRRGRRYRSGCSDTARACSSSSTTTGCTVTVVSGHGVPIHTQPGVTGQAPEPEGEETAEAGGPAGPPGGRGRAHRPRRSHRPGRSPHPRPEPAHRVQACTP